MDKRFLAMVCGGVVLAGCSQQMAAPIINGYGGVAATEVERQPVVAEADMNAIEPAAGRRTVAQAGNGQPQATLVEHRVQATDTVYGLARQYETNVDEILAANSMDAADLRVGQVLKIPAGSKPRPSLWGQMKEMLAEVPARAQEGATSARRVVVERIGKGEPAARVAKASSPAGHTLTRREVAVAAEPAAPAVEEERLQEQVAQAEVEKLAQVEPAAGVPPQKAQPDVVMVDHLVVAGETVYRISRQYDASVLDIMAANALETPQDLRAGMVVKVPTNPRVAVKNTTDDGVVVRTPEKTIEVPEGTVVEKISGKVHEIAGQSSEDREEKMPVAKAPEPKTATEELRAEMKRGQVDPVAAKAEGKVWPVRGEILKRFGEEGNGVAHTGINIAVPPGTPVLATDAGKVLYADDGLKTYGKLVLIQHKNGMVSAYAHNGHLLVRKGEKVKKGQVVATSGASGNVDKPQLHFELRRHASAVDPLRELPQL